MDNVSINTTDNDMLRDKMRSYSVLNTLYHETRQEIDLLNRQISVKDGVIADLKARLGRHERLYMTVGDKESVLISPSNSLVESLLNEICKLKQKKNEGDLKAARQAEVKTCWWLYTVDVSPYSSNQWFITIYRFFLYISLLPWTVSCCLLWRVHFTVSTAEVFREQNIEHIWHISCKLLLPCHESVINVPQEIQRLNTQLREKELELETIRCQPDHEKDREIQRLRVALQEREQAEATRSVLCTSLAEEADQLRRQLGATVKVCQELMARLEKDKRGGGEVEDVALTQKNAEVCKCF